LPRRNLRGTWFTFLSDELLGCRWRHHGKLQGNRKNQGARKKSKFHVHDKESCM
jgi:hypothetical protein